MECTDGCWIWRRFGLTRTARLPGLLVRPLTSQSETGARKQLEKIGGKLIEAQEEERSRIAERTSRRHLPAAPRSSPWNWNKRIADRMVLAARARLLRKSGAIVLKSPVMFKPYPTNSTPPSWSIFGLAAAVGSLCREFSQQHDVNVQFADESVPSFLPAIFPFFSFASHRKRLQNALKHSGAKQFLSASLRGWANEIRLEVNDRGVAFDVERTKLDSGLGLVSMEERVHLVHGTFTIESVGRISRDEKILVRVPLVVETKYTRTTVVESA